MKFGKLSQSWESKKLLFFSFQLIFVSETSYIEMFTNNLLDVFITFPVRKLRIWPEGKKSRDLDLKCQLENGRTVWKILNEKKKWSVIWMECWWILYLLISRVVSWYLLLVRKWQDPKLLPSFSINYLDKLLGLHKTIKLINSFCLINYGGWGSRLNSRNCI